MSSPLRPPKAIRLRAEGLIQPLAVACARPLLSWAADTDGATAEPTGWRLQIARSEEQLRRAAPDVLDHWSEGLEPFRFELPEECPPGEPWLWRVGFFDAGGECSWSEVETFERAAASETDWERAQWIASPLEGQEGRRPRAALLRRALQLERPPAYARLYVAGLGYHEVEVNGCRVGTGVLEPAQTDYDVWALYVPYDVTALLEAGENGIGIWLGDGWFCQDRVWGPDFHYGRPALKAVLVVRQADGTEQRLYSDQHWKAGEGPVLRNNVYAGEEFDARLHDAAWSRPGFDDSAWPDARIVAPLTPRLQPQALPPIRRTQEMPTQEHWKSPSGTWIFDMGQGFAGWVRLQIQAPAGTRLTMRFAEERHPDGSLNPISTGEFYTGVFQEDVYICSGQGLEVWEPRFTYHSFRYVEVTGLAEEPAADLLTGIAVHTDLELNGSFTCSDDLMNRIQAMALWTQRANLHGLPTDCPARERCGWLGDAHAVAPMVLMNFEAQAFWQKYLEDIRHSRGRGGKTYLGEPADPRVPANIAPGLRRCQTARPDWAAAYILIPYFLHLYTGCTRAAERHWREMTELHAYFREIARGHLIHQGYGDWCPPGNPGGGDTPVPLASTLFYLRVTRALAVLGRALGQDAEARAFAALAEEIRGAFVREFFDEDIGTLGTQTANAMAIVYEALDGEQEAAAARALAEMMSASDGAITTGIHGMPCLLPALARHRYDDVIWTVLQRQEYPSVGHLLRLGATTFWEVISPTLEESDAEIRSLCHPMQGAFTSWLYHGIAGIAPVEEAPGFARIHMEPNLLHHLEWARAEHHAPRGRIFSSWKRTGELFEWQIVIPPGSEADLHLPAEVEGVEIAAWDGGASEGFSGNRGELPAGRWNLRCTLEAALGGRARSARLAARPAG